MLNYDLLEEVKEYCKINNISDVESLITKMLKRGFAIEKFGDTAATPEIKIVEKIIEKEVIVEKEVFIEKIITITDDNKVTEIIKELEDKFNDDRLNLIKEMTDKTNEEKTLLISKITELEEKLKLVPKSKPDIYENRMGYFGSNLLDNK